MRPHQRVLLAIVLALAINPLPAIAQLRRPMPPKIDPGTIVDVNDWGGIKQAEFIEVTPRGWIKVRMEDGEEKEFFARDVRVSKVKKLRPKPAGAAAGGGLSGTRTWSDASGKFKIEAAFVGLASGKVELKKADSSTVSVPLEKLSTADQDIARALAAQGGPASAGEENPFTSVDGGPSVADQRKGSATGTANPPSNVRKGDLSGAKQIQLTANEYRPPAIAAAARPKFTEKGIPLPVVQADIRRDHAAFHRMMSERSADYLFVDTHRNHIWAAIEPTAARTNEPIRVERLDLATGKAGGTLMFPPMKRIVDVDASGKLVVAFASHDFHGVPNRLDLFRVTGSKVDPVMQFEPYGDADSSHPENEVTSATVIGTSHLLTSGANGAVVLWRLPDMSAVYSISVGAKQVIPAVSADESVLAVADQSGIFLLETLTGELLGRLDSKVSERASGQLAFDSSGTKLLLANTAGVQVFDVASGKLAKKAATPIDLNGLCSVGFVSEKYVVVKDSLVDLDLGIVLCKYQAGADEPKAIHGGQLWCLLTQREGRSVQRGLAHMDVPHPEALAKAEGITRESLLVARPGDKVGIQLGLSFSGEENQQIKDALIKAIQNNGWVYSDESPVAIIACEVTSQSKSEVFRSFRGEEQNVTLTDYFAKVRLKKGEKTVWETGTAWFAPRSVFAKEGEAAAEVAKHKADWKYFLNVKPPKEVLEYPEGGALCIATVTPTGVTTQ